MSKMKSAHTIKVLSTKTLSDETRDFIKSHPIDLVEHDFITIQKNSSEIKKVNGELSQLNQCAHIILSSPNAWDADFVFTQENVCSFYVVGQRLQTLLERETPNIPVQYGKNATDLLQEMTFSESQNYFYICSSSRLDVLPDFFEKKHIPLKEFHSYDTVKTSKQIKDVFDYVLFFSPSGVKSFFLENNLKNAIPIALGKSTAAPLKDQGYDPIIAERTDQLSMIHYILKKNQRDTDE